MTPEGPDLPGSASPIEYMHDAPLEASGLHPAANMAAKRAGMTPGDWFDARHAEPEPGHGFEHEPVDDAERDSEHTAQAEETAHEPESYIPQLSPGSPQPRLAHNLGAHPAERWAADHRWVTRDELAQQRG